MTIDHFIHYVKFLNKKERVSKTMIYVKVLVIGDHDGENRMEDERIWFLFLLLD